MLPEVDSDLSEGYEVEEQPSLTWKLEDKKQRMAGEVDGLAGVKQAIYCILNTERYDLMIYSWDYGVELKDLIGEPLSYVLPELKRRITEALMQDERIQAVRDFTFDTSKKRIVHMEFTVDTNYGEVPSEMEVDI